MSDGDRLALAERLEQTLRVMQGSRRSNSKTMSVWPYDTKNVEDALFALRAELRDEAVADSTCYVERSKEMREALEPFIQSAAGIPKSISNAAPFARISNDARVPGTIRTITIGEFRRLIAAIAPASANEGEEEAGAHHLNSQGSASHE